MLGPEAVEFGGLNLPGSPRSGGPKVRNVRAGVMTRNDAPGPWLARISHW
jgi:hypothetical protein